MKKLLTISFFVCLLVSSLYFTTTTYMHQEVVPTYELKQSLTDKQISDKYSYLQKISMPLHWKKVSTPLRETIARLSEEQLDLQNIKLSTNSLKKLADPALNFRENNDVQLTIYLNQFSKTNLHLLEKLGYQITFSSKQHLFLEGWLSLANIEEIAKLNFVRVITPTMPAVTNAGSVTSQGDQILLSNRVRQELGITGRGVKVGVISDSVDGLASSVDKGDLPNNVQVLIPGRGIGEGTAMLEIVHDIAPDANLAFCGAATSGGFLSCIEQLAQSGANVIVDDVSAPDQPTFEQGAIAQTINRVVDQGKVYVTAAGNFANVHYRGNFVGFGPIGAGTRNAATFPNGKPIQTIIVPGNSAARVILQWSERYTSPFSDYDLYIADENLTLVNRAIDDATTGNAREQVTFVNSSPFPKKFFVIVDLFGGVPQEINLIYSFNISSIEFATPVSSIVFNNNAANALTVGTINAGSSNNASYSSQGPVRQVSPTNTILNKPEITGVDAVSVTGAAGFSNPFFGTSAASPHIGAIAALMLEANPKLSPQQVKDVMQQTARDFGVPGFDNIYGAGQANAFDAVSRVLSTRSDFSLSVTPSSQTISPGMSISFTVNTQSINGFDQPISLLVRPPNSFVGANFSKDTISPNNSATLTVFADPKVNNSVSVPLTITATSGSLVHRQNIVVNIALNAPPKIGTIADQIISIGQVLKLPVNAIDPDGNTGLRLSLLSAPAYVSLSDNGNGSGELRITPLAGDQTGSVTLQVTDPGGLTAQTSFRITLSTPGPMVAASSIKVTSNKITANGSGFIAPVQVLVDGVAFSSASTIDASGSKLIQKGRLANGQLISEAIPIGKNITFTFRNSNGGITTVIFNR